MENHGSTQKQEIAEPLIRQEEERNIISEEEEEEDDDDDVGGGGGFKPRNISQKGSVGAVWLSSAIAVLGSFLFGCCVHYTSPTQTAIRKDLDLSLPEYSVFASLASMGAMIGAITSGHISDFIGRKGTMRVAAVFCLIGWLAICFTKGVLLLDIGRICTGYGIGVFSYVVPVFIAEIAPKDHRGGFTALNELMIQLGGSITYLLAPVLTWRMLTLVGLIPSLMMLFGMFFVPESPRWLVMVGRQREFEATLQRLRGKDADISCEASEILEYTEKLQDMPKVRILELFQKRYLHSVIIGFVLMLLKQFGGINAVSSYTGAILELAGFSSANFGIVVIGLCQFPMTALAVVLMDRCGRRPLLLISLVGASLGTFLVGISFCLKDHELVLNFIPMMVLAGILIYVWSFALGIGSASWVILSEIFPLNIKGAAGSLAIWVNWFASWIVGYTFNYLMSWNRWGTFFLFSGVSATGTFFVAKLVPETRRRTLEDIQASLLFCNPHSQS